MPSTTAATSTLRIVLLLIVYSTLNSVVSDVTSDTFLSDILELYGLPQNNYFNSASRSLVKVEPPTQYVCRDGTYCVKPWWYEELSQLEDERANFTAGVSQNWNYVCVIMKFSSKHWDWEIFRVVLP